jgi:hypothetical protein
MRASSSDPIKKGHQAMGLLGSMTVVTGSNRTQI